MTREEQIIQYAEKKYKELASPQGELTPEGKGYLIGMGDILRFVETLPKEQPQGLDEAAEEHSKKAFNGLLVEDNIDAFKAGAEWMAGQGIKFESEMSWLDSFGFHIFDCFNEGDKIIVQIRKKQ